MNSISSVATPAPEPAAGSRHLISNQIFDPLKLEFDNLNALQITLLELTRRRIRQHIFHRIFNRCLDWFALLLDKLLKRIVIRRDQFYELLCYQY